MLVRALNEGVWRRRKGLVVTGLLCVQMLVTQPQAMAQEQDDGEPDRGVARISLINGDVSVRRGDSGDWVAAAPNAPLVVEDRVLTGARSRSEVQFDWANFARLAPDTEIRLAELDYRRYLLQVASGTVTFRVLRDSDADVEISTPAVSLRPSKRGSYRVTVLPDGTTEITVRSGEAEIFTTRGSERLKSGRTMLVRGTAEDPEFQVVSAIDKDEWDRWNEGRDRDLERSNSYRYVSRSVYGVEDLDAHGSWVNDPPYGWVWVPRVAAGWAPYRLGRWSWVDWYGWSWVSYDPWGWAPYHYGRWYHGPRGWCWWPGGIGLRHRWSPGLVAWVGFGGGVSVGVGFGRVGWIPLAPYEPYHRWYGWNNYRGWGGRGFGGNNVTVVNNVNITNIYRNSRVRGGMSGMESNDFARGRMGQALRLSDADLDRASLVRGHLPVAPDRNSLRLSDRDAVVTPREGRGDRNNFYSRRTPNAVERVPFDTQQRGMQEMSRRVFGDRDRGVQSASAPGGRIENAEGMRGAAAESMRQGRGSRGSTTNSGIVDGNSPTTGGTPINEKGEVRSSEGRTGSRGSVTAGSPGVSGSDSEEGRGWRRVTSGESRNSGEVAAPSTSRSSRGASSNNNNNSGWRRFGEPRRDSNSGNAGSVTASPEGRATTRRGGISSSSGDANSSGRRNSSEGWRRFGEPSGGRTSPSPSMDSGSGSSRRRSGDFGSPGSSGGGSGVERQRPSFPDTNRSREIPQRNETPRMERSPQVDRPPTERPSMERRAPAPSGERRSFFQRDRSNDGSAGGSRRLDISPPIVRERSAERSTRSPQPQQYNNNRSSNWDRFGGRSSSGMDSSPRMSSPSRMGTFGGGGIGSSRSSGRSWGGSSSGGGSIRGSMGGGTSSPRMSAPSFGGSRGGSMSRGGGRSSGGNGGSGGGRSGRSR